MSNSSVAESVEFEPCGVFLLHHLVPGPVLLPAGNNTVPLEGDTGPWPPEHSKVPLPVRRCSHRELKGSCQQGSSVSVHGYKLATIGLEVSTHRNRPIVGNNHRLEFFHRRHLFLITFPRHFSSSLVLFTCFLFSRSCLLHPLAVGVRSQGI